jgi:hypothetical protein
VAGDGGWSGVGLVVGVLLQEEHRLCNAKSG